MILHAWMRKAWKTLMKNSRAFGVLALVAVGVLSANNLLVNSLTTSSPQATFQEESSQLPHMELRHGELGPVLVSYSYYQVNEVQVRFATRTHLCFPPCRYL